MTRLQELVEDELHGERHAVGHGLLASLRVPEVVTTNFDALYESAATVPFGPTLQVVPWDRAPHRPPWLLKAHGDAVRGSLVLTAEQFAHFDAEHGPVASVIQSLLLLGRHLLFVGHSLRDTDIRALMDEVSTLLDQHHVAHQRFGTVLSIDLAHKSTEPIDPRLPVVRLARNDDARPGETARRLEIFLDRLAWAASVGEASWLLDPRYEDLLSDDDLDLVKTLQGLDPPRGGQWDSLRDALRDLGWSRPGAALHPTEPPPG